MKTIESKLSYAWKHLLTLQGIVVEREMDGAKERNNVTPDIGLLDHEEERARLQKYTKGITLAHHLIVADLSHVRLAC